MISEIREEWMSYMLTETALRELCKLNLKLMPLIDTWQIGEEEEIGF
tara:strand:- start:1046 stop:1186 length:141 start_codon:yes stop_codon:yes gene_type:complete